MSTDNILGIYCHIPFCKTKCNYCDFNSYAGKEALVDDYFKALECEAAIYAEKLCVAADTAASTNTAETNPAPQISSVFIGGGTPSVVDAEKICHLLRHIKARFRLTENAEISIECNPGTLTQDKLWQYLDCGVNRISIGVQSSSETMLQTLGRTHTAKQALESLEMAFKAGFHNVNADLIFGIPGQTLNDWEDALNTVTDYPLKHLSCYSLKIEENTPLHNYVTAGSVTPLDDETDREMYHTTIDVLKVKGFKHYEISNFAVPGFECRHNLIYWHAEEYIGIGAGAHSYLEGQRYHNIESPEAYINEINDMLYKAAATPQYKRHDIDAYGNADVLQGIRHDIECIGCDEAISEFMILGLRLTDGIDDLAFRARFGISIFDKYKAEIDRMVLRGLVEINGKHTKLTALGLDLSNQVFINFI